MIPVRRRACLPPGHWYLVHQPRHGRLVVTVSALVPPNSPLEHELVRDAVKAWRQHQRRGLVLAPAPIAGTGGVNWLARQFRRPAMAVATTAAAASVALAVTVTELHPPAPHRQPTAEAPPAAPVKPVPGRSATPQQPADLAPKRPGPARPRVSHPEVVAAVSTTRVRVDPARLPVRLPVRVPPVHVKPPKVPAPPVTVKPPPVVRATDCRLVTLELKLVRVCV